MNILTKAQNGRILTGTDGSFKAIHMTIQYGSLSVHYIAT